MIRLLAPLAVAGLAACSAAPVSVGVLVVLNKSDATASFLDPVSGATLAVAATGLGPHEAAVTPDGALVVVADYGQREPGSTLTVLDPSGEFVRRVDLGEYTRPHGLTFLSDGRLLVTSETTRSLVLVDVVGGTVDAALDTEQGASHMVAASPDGGRAYVANIAPGTLTALDLESGAVLAIVATGAGCEGVDVTPDGAFVWTSNRAADTVSVVDAEALELVATLDCPGFPIRIKLTPDGGLALVSCPRSGDVAVFDVSRRALVKRIPMELSADASADAHLFAGAFGDSPTPIGIQVRPDGRVAFVANADANKVAVIDLVRLEVVGLLNAGNEPDGLAWLPRRP